MCHNYFVLKKDEPQANDLGTSRSSADEVSYDYFVLDKEGSACGTTGSNIFQRNDGDDDKKQKTQDATHRDYLNENPYFENPLSQQLENGTHQYQKMGQRISTNEPEASKNISHGYFILQRQST